MQFNEFIAHGIFMGVDDGLLRTPYATNMMMFYTILGFYQLACFGLIVCVYRYLDPTGIIWIGDRDFCHPFMAGYFFSSHVLLILFASLHVGAPMIHFATLTAIFFSTGTQICDTSFA